MAKIMSVLEKYKFIEKEEVSVPSSQKEEPTPAIAEDISTPDVDPALIDVSESTNVFNELPPFEPHYSNSQNSEPNKEDHYTSTLSLDEIYTKYNLNNTDVTHTVFVLENLINALPAELPEYVKKTTLQNIIVASAMNLDSLLKDGNKRSEVLDAFLSDYTTKTEANISHLKTEIAKLSAIISEHQQQIKIKETLLQDQFKSVKAEELRLNEILTFFKE